MMSLEPKAAESAPNGVQESKDASAACASAVSGARGHGLRRTYTSPQLKRLGSVRDLTLGSGRSFNDIRAAGRQKP